MRRNWDKKLLCLLILIQLNGCAIQFEDSVGRQRIIGFVSITTAYTPEVCSVTSLEVQTIGLSGVSLPSHGGFNLGYSKNTTIFVSDEKVLPEVSQDHIKRN